MTSSTPKEHEFEQIPEMMKDREARPSETCSSVEQKQGSQRLVPTSMGLQSGTDKQLNNNGSIKAHAVESSPWTPRH